jgi:hypothetical protein
VDDRKTEGRNDKKTPIFDLEGIEMIVLAKQDQAYGKWWTKRKNCVI